MVPIGRVVVMYVVRVFVSAVPRVMVVVVAVVAIAMLINDIDARHPNHQGRRTDDQGRRADEHDRGTRGANLAAGEYCDGRCANEAAKARDEPVCIHKSLSSPEDFWMLSGMVFGWEWGKFFWDAEG
jgi:hypothetical protein